MSAIGQAVVLLHRLAKADGDRELLDRFAARRDEVAFHELVCRHGPLVLAACRRILGSECDVLHVPESSEAIWRKVEAMMSSGPVRH